MESPTSELDSLLEKWTREVYGNTGANPVPILTSIAEIFERETEAYLKLPIDPFDERHPSRTAPESSLGLLLKSLFKNDNFVSQLTIEYMTASWSNFDLHVISCRLLLDILPGLESQVVFNESDTLVKQLIDWAEKAEFPLHSYSTGLLGAAMQVPEISIQYRDNNNTLVPLMLNRLSQLTHISSNSIDQSSDDIDPRDLIDVSETTPSYKIHIKPLDRNVEHTVKNSNSNYQLSKVSSTPSTPVSGLFNRCSINQEIPASIKRPRTEIDGYDDLDDLRSSIPLPKLGKLGPFMHPNRSPLQNDCSSSSWAEAFMSGSYQMHPLSIVMQQRFILQYLSALGDYQELLIHMFEHKALSYILHFIDGKKNPDVRLAFDGLKFLAAFLSHKKFALEFLDYGGLLKLLRVNRHGMASAGVSICLYYLASNEDVLERICWKKEIAEKMVGYALWLLEKSANTSRVYAAIFFSLCFNFPILLKLFDRDNGLRKLLNMISMRGLFGDDISFEELTDDELFQRRQNAKQVCITLKRYTRSHFLLESRKQTRMNTTNTDQDSKAISVSDDNVMEAIELHRQHNFPRFNWRAIDRIVQEEGINYLLKIITRICTDGICYAGKSETVRSALEILVVCSLSPKIQLVLLKETIRTNLPYDQDNAAIGVIMMCADPRSIDPEGLKSALNILINLACSAYAPRVAAPSLNASIDSSDRLTGSGKKKNPSRNMIDLASNLKKAIWANNGTLILPKLLTITAPLTEADAIRSLVSRVLCGLAREDSIKQMMSKLPLFTDGQLQTLMKEPIIPEKRIEHSNFCKYCRELIQNVTGTEVATTSGVEPSLAEIKRRQIVAQTKIIYDKTEAYHLVHNFLNSEGYADIAAAFYKAANLSAKPIKGCVGQPVTRAQPRSPPLNQLISNQINHTNFNVNAHTNNVNNTNNTSSTPDLSTTTTLTTPQTPATNATSTTTRQSLMLSSNLTPAISNMRSNLRTPTHSPYSHQSLSVRAQQMQKSSFQPSNLYKKLDEATNSASITLDSIFTDYLRHQHSLCKNPVASCPPFQLLAPHKCPEPVNRLMAPMNIAARIIRRKVFPPRGGYNGAKYDRHYIYSKFRPARPIRDPMEMRNSSTCCSFSADGAYLFIGTEAGSLKAYNINSGNIEATYECHQMGVGAIQASSDDNLIITTCPYAPVPQSSLWNFSEVFERKHRFEHDHHAEFGKLPVSDRIISTSELHARLWDTATGLLLQKYEGYHRYTHNKATLNYDDTLVLNDGILWDVRRPTAVHKFAKFNERINGIFHPNGTEIICNSQVWDVRNHRLLQTVPAFDQSQLRFNSGGDVIFSTILDDQNDLVAGGKDEFKTSFRTFDSHDYSTIATIELKRTISDLAISSGDRHLALIESTVGMRPLYDDYMESNVCRLYEVGLSRWEADEDDEDDEDEDEDDDEDGDPDDDDNDDDLDEDDDIMAESDTNDGESLDIGDTDEEEDDVDDEVSDMGIGLDIGNADIDDDDDDDDDDAYEDVDSDD